MSLFVRIQKGRCITSLDLDKSNTREVAYEHTPKCFAGFHKLSFKPNNGFDTTDETVNELTTKLFNIPLSVFENRSSGKSQQHLETLTYNRLIDLTFKNTRQYGKCLDRVTIQGAAFDYLTFNTDLVQQLINWEEFRVVEVHSSGDVVGAYMNGSGAASTHSNPRCYLWRSCRFAACHGW